VRRLGLAPLLHRALSDAADLRAALFAPDYRHSTVSNLLRLGQARRVRQALAARDLPCVLLKGGAFLARLAPGDPGIRPMADIDLLVDPARFDEAAHVLSGLGFHRTSERYAFSRSSALAEAFVRDEGPFPVEIDLHRALAPWPILPGLTRSVLSHSERVGEWLVAPVAETLALIAVHRARHAFFWSCGDLLEVRHLLGGLDEEAWQRAIARVTALGALGAVYATLKQAIYWLGPETTSDRTRLEALAAGMGRVRRRVLDRVAHGTGPLAPPLTWHRPMARYLVVYPASMASLARSVAAGLVYLPARAADEWTEARRAGGGVRPGFRALWHHLAGGTAAAQTRRATADRTPAPEAGTERA